MEPKTLILGNGEVGRGLADVLKKHYVVDIHDPAYNKEASGKYEVINICFPWSDQFDNYVLEYIKRFDPKVCIIHSTVSPKTTLLDNSKIVFSPIRGKHPNLVEGILTFEKLVGGIDEKTTTLATRFLVNAWIKVVKCTPMEAVMAKLLDTTYYGVCIAFAKTCKEICDVYGLDFNIVYSMFNDTYNKGYKEIGLKNVIRPVLDPPEDEGVGGHCVFQNCEILNTIGRSGFFDSVLAMGKKKGTEDQAFSTYGAKERFLFFKPKKND